MSTTKSCPVSSLISFDNIANNVDIISFNADNYKNRISLTPKLKFYTTNMAGKNILNGAIFTKQTLNFAVRHFKEMLDKHAGKKKFNGAIFPKQTLFCRSALERNMPAKKFCMAQFLMKNAGR